jgi:hypothetical protein
MNSLSRREWIVWSGELLWPALATSSIGATDRKRKTIHMMNYVTTEDFPLMKQLHINTVLVEFDKNGRNWTTIYDAGIRHGLKIIPLIWGNEQSIWQWNDTAKEWELNDQRYPQSIGARFLRFLRDHPRYREQTFAIYSFHEPLAQPEQTNPSRLKKFYQQITEEVFPSENVKVYGEDMTYIWPQADECLTGVLDYEVHTIYPFANSSIGRYRPFLPQGHYGKATSDLDKVLDLQKQTIERQLEAIRTAKPAKNGRKPQLIGVLQAFVDPTENGLWDRMPDAQEMTAVAKYLIDRLGDRFAGIAWYPFRQAAIHYTNWLHKDRYDEHGRDRWQAVAEIGKKLHE